MTEEIPLQDKEDYGFTTMYEGEDVIPSSDMYEYPRIYFKRLEELETNSPDYCRVQGKVFEYISGSAYGSRNEGLQVSRLLNKGEIEEARSLTEEVLEE